MQTVVTVVTLVLLLLALVTVMLARRDAAHERAAARRDTEDTREEARSLMSEAQLEAAAELAARRWARLEGQEREVRVRRVVAHLGRKGYPPSLAFALVKDLQRADIEGYTETG